MSPYKLSCFLTQCLFQATAKRQFAAQAVAKTERELVKAEPLKVSTLSNGLTVASLENHSPVATIGVVIKVMAMYRVSQHEYLPAFGTPYT